MAYSRPRTPAEVRALLSASGQISDADLAAVRRVIADYQAVPASLSSARTLVDQAARLLEHPRPVAAGGGLSAPTPLPPVEDEPLPPVAPPPEPEVLDYRIEIELRDPYDGTGLQPPPVGRRTHARHHRFLGTTTISYAPYYGGEVSDPVPASGRVPFTAPARERRPGRFEVAPAMFYEVRGIFLWASPTGSAALLGPGADLAVGRVYVPRSRMQSVIGGATATLSVRIEVVESVAGYMASEMRLNLVHPVTVEIARLNAEANAIYAGRLGGAVRATHPLPGSRSGTDSVIFKDEPPLNRIDVATASTRAPSSLRTRRSNAGLELAAGTERQRYALAYIANRLRGAGAGEVIPDLQRYHDLKSEAFDAWGEKVRKEPYYS